MSVSTGMPNMRATGASSFVARIASIGTCRTFLRSAAFTVTSPFMPGMSSPSLLLMLTSTGKNVTPCVTTACGSIFSSMPSKVRPANASTATVAGRSDADVAHLDFVDRHAHAHAAEVGDAHERGAAVGGVAAVMI